MILVNAFLAATIAAYLIEAFLPEPAIRDMPKWIERIFMLASGTLLLADLLVNIPVLWLLSGAFWAFATVRTFLGYVKWNVSYRIGTGLIVKTSDEAQMFMALWDLAIAVVCFMKL